jgi:hypothetical protein
MSSANITRDQNDQQRGEWEGFGTSGSYAQKGPDPQRWEKPMTESVSDAASAAAREAGDKAESAIGAVSCGMKSLAQNIRDHAPEAGVVGSAAAAVAQTLDRGGHYLEEEGLKGMADDLTNLVRKNPLPALVAGIGLGFLIAQLTRSRS